MPAVLLELGGLPAKTVPELAIARRHSSIPRPGVPIIQGGMAIHILGPDGVSIVSKEGGLGTIALTASEVVLSRKLQLGDTETLQALQTFPKQEIAKRIIEKYYVKGGIPKGQRFKSPDMWELDAPERWALITAPRKEQKQIAQKHLQEEAVAGAYCEVLLAKQKADGGVVSANAMRKIDLPFGFYVLGAMAAGVDVITVGAGSPADVPELLDNLAMGRKTRDRIHVAKEHQEWFMTIDPEELLGRDAAQNLKRPPLLAIVSHIDSARGLIANPRTRPEGIVFELYPAGGHNAPALLQPMTKRTEYTERDKLDLAAAADLMSQTRRDDPDFLFAIGGGFSNPVGMNAAREWGFDAVQVGTPFALTDESNINRTTKARMLFEIFRNGSVPVVRDAQASGSGLPFHVAQVRGTQSDTGSQQACTVGYLLRQVEQPDGVPEGRCPAMPVGQFTRLQGRMRPLGTAEVCRGLFADVVFTDPTTGEQRSLGQREDVPIVTLGDDQSATAHLVHNLEPGKNAPTIPQVMETILFGPKAGSQNQEVFASVQLPVR